MTDDDIRRLVGLLGKVAAARLRVAEAITLADVAGAATEVAQVRESRLSTLLADLSPAQADFEDVEYQQFLGVLQTKVEDARFQLAQAQAISNPAYALLGGEMTILTTLEAVLFGWRIADPPPPPTDHDQ